MTSSSKEIQLAFAAHIRNPNNPPPPNIEQRRLKIYRELFYNNVEGFISRGFPVLREIYSDERWHQLVRDFFEHHACQSPYFLEIGEEFLEFLQTERDLSQDPPFIIELAHYEWVELALDISTDSIPSSGINPTGDLLNARPAISPLAWPLQYQWPVHKICPQFQPDQTTEITYLIVYRNKDLEVKFMEINSITARLLSLLKENESFTGMDAVKQISKETNIDIESLISGGQSALDSLRTSDIVLGTLITSV